MYSLFYYWAELTALINLAVNFFQYIKPPYIGTYYTDFYELTKYAVVGVITAYTYYYVKLQRKRKVVIRRNLNYPPVRLTIQGEYP